MAYSDRWEPGAYWRRTIAATLDFRGRSSRTEVVYWWLLGMAVAGMTTISAMLLFMGVTEDWIRTAVNILMALPFFALFARRLQDQERPAWIAVIAPIAIFLSLLRHHYFEQAARRTPFDQDAFPSAPLERAAGALVLIVLVLLFLPGTEGPNRYGEDPRI